MKPTKYFHKCCLLPVILLSVILAIAGCGGNASVNGALDIAENLLDNRPASALEILDSIDASALTDESLKARYALLKSMALDKNYVDTTTFGVLQPAIDYYLKKGTPDEKLRTYYYQGRIYQNKNERDSAILSFMRGLDIANDCKDSLMIAKALVAQGIMFKDFYDIDGYAKNYLKAAHIYGKKNNAYLEFDCLLNALNGMNILGNKEKAESIIRLLDRFDSLDNFQTHNLRSQKITYTLRFGLKHDIRNLIEINKDNLNYDANGILNLARAYNRIGDNKMAIRLLSYLEESGAKYDTLKYLSIKYMVLEDEKDYEGALSTYRNFSNRLEAINSSKFEQKSQSMEERHRMELQAERDARQHAKMMWKLAGGIAVLIVVVVFMLLMINNVRAQKYLAVQKARTAELENEYLAHRVEVLESESENLKELLQTHGEMPAEVRAAIQERIEMLNSYLASQISDHKEFEKSYDKWVEELTADTEKFMDSNRLAFQASHPRFIRYFEEHGLTTAEINYVCLYAIGLRGKDVGNYMKKRSHVNISSAIRKKLGIDQHETNIGIYVRKLLVNL